MWMGYCNTANKPCALIIIRDLDYTLYHRNRTILKINVNGRWDITPVMIIQNKTKNINYVTDQT